jgi:hypothetical protein
MGTFGAPHRERGRVGHWRGSRGSHHSSHLSVCCWSVRTSKHYNITLCHEVVDSLPELRYSEPTYVSERIFVPVEIVSVAFTSMNSLSGQGLQGVKGAGIAFRNETPSARSEVSRRRVWRCHHPDDRGSMYLQNVGLLQRHDTALYPRRLRIYFRFI